MAQSSPALLGSLRKLGRDARSILGVVTPLGWGILAVTAGVGLLAWLTEWEELYAVGIALAVLSLVAGMQSWGRTTYEIDLELGSHRVRQGDRVSGRLAIRNASKRRLMPAALELPVGSSVATFRLPAIPANAEIEELFIIPTMTRAVLMVGPAMAVRSDALGLVSRRRTWAQRHQVFVHPRTVALTQTASGQLRDLEGIADPSFAESSLAFHALREYVPGDDVRKIHWRSTARLGTVMVRQDQDVRRTRTAVTLATSQRDYMDGEEFELAVSVAASWGVQAMRDGADVDVHVGESLPDHGVTRFLDTLAGVETQEKGTTAPDLTAWVSRHIPDAALAVVVTGAVADPLELRSALTALPINTIGLAISCAPGSRLEMARSGRHTLVRCGDLADLPRVVRRLVG